MGQSSLSYVCVSSLRLQTLARTGQRYRKNGRLVHATTPRALGSEVCPACWRGESRGQIGWYPIIGRRLTPAKLDMVFVVGEWLEAAGTVHQAEGALGPLSLREARTPA